MKRYYQMSLVDLHFINVFVFSRNMYEAILPNESSCTPGLSQMKTTTCIKIGYC